MDRLLTAGLCGNTLGQDIQTLTYHSSTSNMAAQYDVNLEKCALLKCFFFIIQLFLLFNNQNFIHHHSIQCSTFQSITCSATSHHQHQCNKTKDKHMDINQLLSSPAHHTIFIWCQKRSHIFFMFPSPCNLPNSYWSVCVENGSAFAAGQAPVRSLALKISVIFGHTDKSSLIHLLNL